MFTIDTGDSGGSQGPWISWTSNGSAMKGFAPKSWVVRDKDANGAKTETVVPGFAAGCVMDLDTLKLGWERDSMNGGAPERRWNPSIAQATPRPDESKKQSGAFAWSRALSVRLAIGGGKCATWEQGSFGAYEAFSRLSTALQSGYQPGMCPMIKQTGVEQRKLPSGTANIPILEVVKWVPKPDCLKEAAPKIDTGTAAPAAPVAQPAAQPAPAMAGADDMDEF